MSSRPAAGRRQGRRARGRGQINEIREFMPPETWHEPRLRAAGYRVVVQQPGAGYCHVVTADEVRERLAMLPSWMIADLEIVQLSRMTRKKRSMPLYGMQWGRALYLYPIESNLVEVYHSPPDPAQRNEARLFGGRWRQAGAGQWHLEWTLPALKDFYLNNILIHELGHLLDYRNTRTIDRERFAEWFAVEYGYLPTQANRHAAGREVVVRHGKR